MTLASHSQSPTGTSKPHKSFGGLPAAQFNRLYPKRSGAEVSGSASGRPERFGYNPLHYLAFEEALTPLVVSTQPSNLIHFFPV